MSTNEATAAGHRWARAQERAGTVLDGTELTLRQRSAAPLALLLSGAAAVVVALVLLGLALPSDAPARWVVGVTVAVVALVGLIVQLVRRRRRAGRVPTESVVALLQTRERHAVRQAFHGRRPVPDDRRDVVDAAAVQAATNPELPILVVSAVLPAGIAFSGTPLWPMYAVLALVDAAFVVVPALDALAARRWLSQHPRVGAGPTTDFAVT